MPKPVEIYKAIGVVIFTKMTDKFLRIMVKRPDLTTSTFTTDCPMNLTISYIENSIRDEYGIKRSQINIPYYIKVRFK